jgi:hypothetical protein
MIFQVDSGISAAGGLLMAGRSFTSFRQLKRFVGSAGEDMVWHHIVEQSKTGEFGAGAIQNTTNVMGVSRSVNQSLADYYSSKQAFTNGLTVRQWLKGQSWSTQFEFGFEKLQLALRNKPL